MQFLHFSISPGSAETLVRRGGIINHHLIAYSLSNISAKNYQNRLVYVEVIVCNISVVFFETQCTSITDRDFITRMIFKNIIDPDIYIHFYLMFLAACLGYYIHQVNRVKLADILFSLLSVCVSVRTQSSLQQWNDILFADKCTRLVHEKLIIFTYWQYIVGICVSLAFWWYSQVQDRSRVLGEMYKKVTVIRGPVKKFCA